MIKEINGCLFADMVISGANNLCNYKKLVDDLNVFPVPDGDTGTNMSMTISSCVPELQANREKNVSEVAKVLAYSTLRGARGNSGVILSQLMRGISKTFSDNEVATLGDFSAAFKKATETAYRAVMKPTEGTILTVARETSECLDAIKNDYEDILEAFEVVVKKANESLDNTPNLLPQLKQAGVVDSGGKGLVLILEGALSFLKTGEIIPLSEAIDVPKSSYEKADIEVDIKFCYCTEFIIEKSDKKSDVFKFKTTIEHFGDSMVVIDDEEIIKVHIHTNTPDKVLCEALKLGSLINIKIENMKYQHNEIISNKESAPMKKYGFVAVSVGDGFRDKFAEYGIDNIIQGGQTMNPSTDDILLAVDKINAENIIVFPNNKNIILSANQVKDLSEKNVIVMETRSIPEAFAAMMVFDEELDVEENLSSMNEMIDAMSVCSVTKAVRDTVVDGLEIKLDNDMGIIDGKIRVVSDKGCEDALCESLKLMVNDESGVVTVYAGEEVEESTIQELSDSLEEMFPECDVIVTSGGQPVYSFVASVE